MYKHKSIRLLMREVRKHKSIRILGGEASLWELVFRVLFYQVLEYQKPWV